MSTPSQTSLFQENKTYASLIECAQQITDRRIQYKIDYSLWEIIVLAICAMLAGADNNGGHYISNGVAFLFNLCKFVSLKSLKDQ